MAKFLNLEDLRQLPEGFYLCVSAKELLALIDKPTPVPQSVPTTETFSEKEALSFFGNISRPTFYRLRKRHGLKNVSPSPRRSLYLRDDCMAILAKMRHSAYSEAS